VVLVGIDFNGLVFRWNLVEEFHQNLLIYGFFLVPDYQQLRSQNLVHILENALLEFIYLFDALFGHFGLLNSIIE
jgi:hypothetical protein